MNFTLLGRFYIVGGKLGSLILKGSINDFSYSFCNKIYYVLFATRKIRRRFKSYITKFCRDLYFGYSKSLIMIGMGLKYELTLNGDLRVHLAFSHFIDFDFSEDIVFFRHKDKSLLIYSGSIVHLNDVYFHLIQISKLSKYKEKGIMDAILPVKLRIRKEKRR